MRISSFAVCGAIISPANERSRLNRKSLPTRLSSPDMILYTLYAIYALSPLIFCLKAYLNDEDVPQLFSPFTGPVIMLLNCVWKVLVPVRYMIWPPTVPEWEKLVKMDGMGVKRPRKDWEKNEQGHGIWWVSLGVCELCMVWLCISY